MPEYVYLFPLPNSVLLKGVSIPYHVFEPRYLKMIKDAIDKNNYISTLLPEPTQNYAGRICVAGSPSIIQTYKNGELDIVITGKIKCKLSNCVQSNPYLSHNFFELTEDQNIFDEEDIDIFKRSILNFVSLHPTMSQQESKIEQLLNSPEAIINYATLLLVNNPNEKEKVMEAETFAQKADILRSYLIPENIDMGPFLTPIKKD